MPKYGFTRLRSKTIQKQVRFNIFKRFNVWYIIDVHWFDYYFKKHSSSIVLWPSRGNVSYNLSILITCHQSYITVIIFCSNLVLIQSTVYYWEVIPMGGLTMSCMYSSVLWLINWATEFILVFVCCVEIWREWETFWLWITALMIRIKVSFKNKSCILGFWEI